jgi:hypothetical protein
MKGENEFGIRLNEFGETDVDYYIAKGHKMRSEAIGAGFKTFKTWLMDAIDRAWFPPQGTSEPRKRIVHSDWPWVDMILQGTPDRKIGHV